MPIIDIPYSPTVIEVDMAAQARCISLAPGESDTYTFNWLKVLYTDRIMTSEWRIEPVDDAPVSVVASSVATGNVATVVELTVDPDFEGCAELNLTNTVETEAGRVLKRCIAITVEKCGGCGC